MTLEDLLQRLSYGPLSNLAISNQGDGTIVTGKIPGVVSFANEALLRLHSKFVLVEKELVLEQDEAITRYLLTSQNSASYKATHPTAPGYIQDTVQQPYTDDLIRVVDVFDVEGCRVPLNDEKQPKGVFTPSFNVLQVPYPVQGQPLYVLYQAKHATLLPDQLSDPINIPDVLEEALIAYTAHKVFFHMNGQEHTLKANDHLTRYTDICTEVIDKDLVNSSISNSSSKFDQRGFN
jgi:hypothetical protein